MQSLAVFAVSAQRAGELVVLWILRSGSGSGGNDGGSGVYVVSAACAFVQ